MKHTPGRWYTAGDTVFDQKGRTIAVMHRNYPAVSDDERKANADLMAAAPKILELANALLAAEPCSDPDCCARAIKHTQAVERLKELVERF